MGVSTSNTEHGLLEEILVRLPVKSLLRFKSTCKPWRSLIKSTSFVEFYAQRRRFDHQDYSFFGPSSDLITTPLFDFEKYNTTVLGPLSNNRSIYLVINHDFQKGRISVATSKIALCNPATREYKFTNPFPKDAIALLSSTMDQTPPLVHYGFGSIRNEDGIVIDYKVVVIIIYRYGDNDDEFPSFMSFVYSLRRGSWEKIADVGYGASCSVDDDSKKAVSGLVNENSEIETPFFIRFGIVRCERLFLHGCWHWLDLLEPRTSTRKKYKSRVLVFDFVYETFRAFGGPPHDEHWCVNCGLALVDDHLVAIYLPHVDKCCVGIDLWMMMEYGVEESWTKIYSCTTNFNRSLWSVIGFWYVVVDDFSVNVRSILLDDADTRQLVSCDCFRVKEHDFRLRDEDILWNTRGISTYVETLDSLTFITDELWVYGRLWLGFLYSLFFIWTLFVVLQYFGHILGF